MGLFAVRTCQPEQGEKQLLGSRPKHVGQRRHLSPAGIKFKISRYFSKTIAIPNMLFIYSVPTLLKMRFMHLDGDYDAQNQAR